MLSCHVRIVARSRRCRVFGRHGPSSLPLRARQAVSSFGRPASTLGSQRGSVLVLAHRQAAVLLVLCRVPQLHLATGSQSMEGQPLHPPFRNWRSAGAAERPELQTAGPWGLYLTGSAPELCDLRVQVQLRARAVRAALRVCCVFVVFP